MSNKRKKQLTQKIEEAAVVYGPAHPKTAPRETEQVVDRIRAGLPYSEFEALRQLLQLTSEELAERLGISRSTLARRKTAGRLDKDQSDKVVRFARVFATVEAAFDGDGEAALQWLKTPQRGLAYSAPLDFTDTEVGAREVERLIGRIEYGVYS